MEWIEVAIHTTDDGVDSVYAAFECVGISEISVEESKEAVEAYLQETAKNWDFADVDEICKNSDTVVKGYLANEPGVSELINKIHDFINSLKANCPEIDFGSLKINTKLTSDEDWANNWKKYYKPLPIGERLLICPSWEPVPENNTRTVVTIDPGMAFGTGLHATTSMCMEFLEKTVEARKNVVDFGCGSGILSITAKLLGASNMLAVDIDSNAAIATQKNAALNGIPDENIEICCGDVLGDEAVYKRLKARSFDVAVANIVAGVIIPLTPLVPGVLNKNGYFITSGIIRDRLDEVKEAIQNNGFEILEVNSKDEWNAILARKLD